MAHTLFRLSAGDARHWIPKLTRLLIDVVDHGASVGFLPPLAPVVADAYWLQVVDAVTEENRRLWVAVEQERLLGTGQLDLCLRPNGLHRAEVSKLLVHSTVRRRGVGRALMGALEEDARALGRTTLVLDTRLGDSAEQLYQGIGFQKAGEIPRYVSNADGQYEATVIYYKLL